MELFYAEGADIVRELKRRGHKIFLDLKLHDIPNTVKKTMRVLSALDIDMCNVHAGGTIAMMQAAKEGLTREDGTRPLLIAVTQLTSTDSNSLKKNCSLINLWMKLWHVMQKMLKLRGWTGLFVLRLNQEEFTLFAEMVF